MNASQRRRFFRGLFFLLSLLGVVGTLSAAEPRLQVSTISLHIDGAKILADVFVQNENVAPTQPTILVLHGAGGMLFDGPEMRRVARHLAAAGNAVYLIHYFDRTGTIFARDATMQRNFEAWLATVRGAIVAVQNLRHSSRPVGVYGYSLGAFLSLAAASDNPRVGAVVEQAGGVWNGRMNRIGKMPPVLMIHGREDARVPFAKYAEPLVPVLRARAAKLETRFFPGEGHGFTQPAMVEVRAAAARFFAQNLRGAR